MIFWQDKKKNFKYNKSFVVVFILKKVFKAFLINFIIQYKKKNTKKQRFVIKISKKNQNSFEKIRRLHIKTEREKAE